MSKGTVVQVIGAVIDVEFSKEELPKIYDCLLYTSDAADD